MEEIKKNKKNHPFKPEYYYRYTNAGNTQLSGPLLRQKLASHPSTQRATSSSFGGYFIAATVYYVDYYRSTFKQ